MFMIIANLTDIKTYTSFLVQKYMSLLAETCKVCNIQECLSEFFSQHFVWFTPALTM